MSYYFTIPGSEVLELSDIDIFEKALLYALEGKAVAILTNKGNKYLDYLKDEVWKLIIHVFGTTNKWKRHFTTFTYIPMNGFIVFSPIDQVEEKFRGVNIHLVIEG